MACWVVPAVAADLWGVPLLRVMELIRDGHVPSKLDCDFLLVDVAPDSPQMPAPQPRQLTPVRRTTFTAVAIEDDVEAVESQDDVEPVTETDGDAPSWERVREEVSRGRTFRAKRAA